MSEWRREEGYNSRELSFALFQLQPKLFERVASMLELIKKAEREDRPATPDSSTSQAH
jgi:hypothetical protein